jgi:D-alanyl-D-alanine carboxypeptidase
MLSGPLAHLFARAAEHARETRAGPQAVAAFPPSSRLSDAGLNNGTNVPISFRQSLIIVAVGAALAGPAAAGPYLLIDAESGKVLAQHDAGQPWHPASVTKLMTAYMAFRAMREGRLQPTTLLNVSELATSQAPSKMGFAPGTKVTVDNALKMLMVKSANDMAVVLAEGVGGTLPDFIAEMNRVATQLGMTASRFANPNGLPDDGQITTARDMAILARAIMHEFPEHEMLFRIPALRFGRKVMRNPNRLLDRFPGADGMKTGFICSSGFNVVASAKRGDKRVIAVVFGAYSSWQRAEDAARLLERGFEPRFSLAALFSSDRRAVEAIANVDAAPVDLRNVMCNPKRKRPAAESDQDDDEESGEDPAAANGAKAAKEKKKLLVDLPPSMAPVHVYAGAVAPPLQKEAAEGRRKKGKKAAKKTETRAAEVKADGAAKGEVAKKKAEKKQAAEKKPAPEKKTVEKKEPQKKSTEKKKVKEKAKE